MGNLGEKILRVRRERETRSTDSGICENRADYVKFCGHLAIVGPLSSASWDEDGTPTGRLFALQS